MPEEEVLTIFDRPAMLRFIGITQMIFGALGLISAIGLTFAMLITPSLAVMGPIYITLIVIGVVIPGFVIGNYVDDLRRWAVVAQIIYSIAAVALASIFLYNYGLFYYWSFPLFETSIQVAISNVAVFVIGIESIFILYLLVQFNKVAPSSDVKVVRDREVAKEIEKRARISAIGGSMLSPDGESVLSPEQVREIMEIRKISTDKGMAILCSNCGGATPLTEAKDDNTIDCEYCGVRLAIGGVFVPCENHDEYLAATSCAVCGDHFCRLCLTAQEPPVDERWEGSLVYLCQKCFEGRYRPAVTTTSLVLPIDQLFSEAGGRFSRVGGIYKKFLEAYGKIMKDVMLFGIRIAGKMAKSKGGRKSDDAAAFMLILIIIIVAIPIAVGLILLLGAIVIVPIIFYAGLIGVAIEAVRILRRTDFISLEEARDQGLKKGRPHEVAPPSPAREATRPWQLSSGRGHQYESDSYRKRF